VPLYSVKFRTGAKLWSFAYVGGRFRWVGKLRKLPSRESLVVTVEPSTRSLVPSAAEAQSLQVVIRNASQKTVEQVPTRYDGDTVILYGRGDGHLWPLALRLSRRVKQVYMPLKPGEKRILMRVPPDAIPPPNEPD